LIIFIFLIFAESKFVDESNIAGTSQRRKRGKINMTMNFDANIKKKKYQVSSIKKPIME
jgi:hypothetical protein